MSDVRVKPPASDPATDAQMTTETALRYSHRPEQAEFSDARWPAWKVTVFVIAFCGAFWAGLAYLLVRLLG